MYKQFTFIILALAMLAMPLAHAAIYKHVDANGNVTYSNVKIKGGEKLAIEPSDTSFGTHPEERPASTKAPSDFPKVDNDTQKQRDNSRKKVLQAELESEEIALENAKIAYDKGKANPEIYHKKNANGSSSTFRNVPKFEAKMEALQQTVDTHQRNVELLQKEIANTQ